MHFKLTRERIKNIMKWGLPAIAIVCLFPIVLFLMVYYGYYGKLYTKEELRNIQSYVASEVYSDDNRVLGKYYWENRSNTDFENIPHILIETLIATEDARFYEHNGIDFKSMFRVFFKTLMLQDKGSGGGSTIGQQLAKNLFKRKRHGILTMPVNKIKEAIYAVRFNNTYTQDEVLAMYLNTVSAGEDTYGIKNAALRFFNKPPDSLTIEEGAMLIGMLKNPTIFNPRLHPESALVRRNVVINNLADRGYIKQTEADSLKNIPLKLYYNNTGMYGAVAPYFLVQVESIVNSILDTLRKNNGEKYNLYTDGLKIYTPINYQMQEYAIAAIRKHMQYLQNIFDVQWRNPNIWKHRSNLIEKGIKASKRYKNMKEDGASETEINTSFRTPIAMELFDWDSGHKATISPIDSIKYYTKFLQTGFLALDPNSGEIKVWVGGNDYTNFQYDHVTSKRQVGSTFKPIVYATAIEQGMSPCDYIKNEQHIYTDYDNWSPANADGKYEGRYSLKGALANSINVVTVEVLFKAGIANVIRTAQNMGIESIIPLVPSIALGVSDISLLEMVKAYCTFPNGGKSVTPVFISRIEDKNGKIIYESKTTKYKRALSKQTAYYMTEMLKGVINEGTASRLRGSYGLSGEMAGKTGTTQSQADGWFIGYTPNLVAGAWVGAENPSIHFNSLILGQGASTALPIWAYFMQKCKADNDCRKLVNGRFYFGNDIIPMPECASYMDDNIFDQIQDWFKGNPQKRLERKKARQERREKRKHEREERRKKN